MIDREEILDNFSGTIQADAVISLIEEKIKEIDSIRGIETMKELLGRRIAIRKLEELALRFKKKEKRKVKNEYY